MCGVSGIIMKDPNDSFSYDDAEKILKALHHRGENAKGIFAARSNGSILIRRQKISEVMGDLRKYIQEPTPCMIFHSRWATQGAHDNPKNWQPFDSMDHHMPYVFGYNGNLMNYAAQKLKFEELGYKFKTTSDTELFHSAVSRNWNGTLENTLITSFQEFIGAYCLIFWTQDPVTQESRLVSVRDPYGIHPLWIAEHDRFHMVASETHIFNALGLDESTYTRLEPGQIVTTTNKGPDFDNILRLSSGGFRPTYTPCGFEKAYFEKHDSIAFQNGDRNVRVYKVREKIGRLLARYYLNQGMIETKDLLIIPIPDSGVFSAFGVYLELRDYGAKWGGPNLNMMDKMPHDNGHIDWTDPNHGSIISKHLDSRSYTQVDLAARTEVAIGKRRLHPDNIDLKTSRCLIVDDSLVEGLTSKTLISTMRELTYSRLSREIPIDFMYSFYDLGQECERGVVIKPGTLYNKMLGDKRKMAEFIGLRVGEHLLSGIDAIVIQAFNECRMEIGLPPIVPCMECSGQHPHPWNPVFVK